MEPSFGVLPGRFHNGSVLAFTGHCQYQLCMVYGIHKGGLGGVVYCAIVVR